MTRPLTGRSLKVSVTANIAGRAYMAIAGVIFVPIYLHFLGVESYGLFALLNSYMSIAALLDLGFSGAITRELATLSTRAPRQMRDVVWTISVPYCAATALLGLGIYIASPWIAAIAFSKAESSLDGAIVDAIGFGGFALVLQLPIYLYCGGLAGIQRQDITNLVLIASTTARHGAAFLLLWLVSSSVVALMAWQAVLAALTAVALFILLWRRLPRCDHWPRIRWTLLQDTWRFAAGLGALTIAGTLTFVSINAIIGALLPLTDVGHYMIASTIATNLVVMAQPVSDAAFPRLAQLMAGGNWPATHATLHKLNQLLIFMVLPVAATIAAFPKEFLTLWTGNVDVAEASAPYLRCLAIGASGAAFWPVPNAYILATGRTGFLTGMTAAIGGVAIFALYIATSHFGGIGAAVVVSTYLAIGVPAVTVVLYPLLPRREWQYWLRANVVVPATVVGGIVFLVLALTPRAGNRIEILVLLSLTWLVTAIAAAWVMPHTREQTLLYWSKFRAYRRPPISEHPPPTTS